MKYSISNGKIFAYALKISTLVLFFFVFVGMTATMVAAEKTLPPDLTPNSGTHKSFYLFTDELPLNETKLGIKSDIYSPNIFVVNKGDTITIHFYNLDGDGKHTFNLGAPFHVNEDVAPKHNATFTFKAVNEGIFQFYCKQDPPTMTGQLIVLPPQSTMDSQIKK